MNYSDIKSDIYDHLDQLKEKAHPEDLLTELADSACPIYYNDIISDWQEMPSEFNDSWQESGTSENATIFSLMSIDLFNYYYDQYTEIFAEVMEDQEQLESESENA
jgi:hypothetical protein